MDERGLAERLITYDTSGEEGIHHAAAFVKGWLESHDLQVQVRTHNGLPVLLAEAGAPGGTRVILHGHLDVVPAPPSSSSRGWRAIGCSAAAPMT